MSKGPRPRKYDPHAYDRHFSRIDFTMLRKARIERMRKTADHDEDNSDKEPEDPRTCHDTSRQHH